MEFLSDAVAGIVKNNQEPNWLEDLRLASLQQFERLPKPVSTDDDWRRTDVNRILFPDLEVEQGKVFYQWEREPWTPAFHRRDLQSSALLREGGLNEVLFLPLSQAVREVPELARPYLEQSQTRNIRKFPALANALWNGGLFLHVPKNKEVAGPLAAVLVPGAASGSGRPRGFISKSILVLEENSSATLLLDQARPEDWEGWADSVGEIHLKQNARLSLVFVQRGGKATSFSSFYARLERQSALNLITVQSDAALSKAEWNADLTGPGASAELYGLTQGGGTQHFDQTVYVSHSAPNAQSGVLFKTVMRDKSRSVFTGLIHVKKNASKTDAHQTNRNLLLGKDARADTIPKLEIETDDVKCGHGAAVSSIDPDQLYYLMSRGLTRGQAEGIIIDGFYEDVLGRWGEGCASPAKDGVLEWLRAAQFGGRVAEAEAV